MLLSAVVALGTSTAAWASEEEMFTDGPAFMAEEGLVDENVPRINFTILKDGQIGKEYFYKFKTDYEGAVTWKLGEGCVLPEGMTLSSDGVLSGIPGESGNFSVYLTLAAGNRVSGDAFHLCIRDEEGKEPEKGDSIRANLFRVLPETEFLDLGERMEGYAEVPSCTVKVENISDETIRLHLNRFYTRIYVGKPEKELLEPGESTEVEVRFISGLEEGAYDDILYFFAKGQKSGKELSQSISFEFRVRPYVRLQAPEIRHVDKSGGNSFKIQFKNDISAVEGADGYQAAAVHLEGDLEKENYLAIAETASEYVTLKYLPKGICQLYTRSFDETENGREYGEWAFGGDREVLEATPTTPSITETRVRYCDLKVLFNTADKVDGFDLVLARKKNGSEPSDYALVKKGISPKSESIVLGDLARGAYYVAIHSYCYGANGKKVFSRWSNLVQVRITRPRVTTPPAVKSAHALGRKVTVVGEKPVNNHGCYWVLSKKYNRDKNDPTYMVPRKASYTVRTTDNRAVFKNVEPGVYYVFGRGYLQTYHRYYTKWSKPRKIRVY